MNAASHAVTHRTSILSAPAVAFWLLVAIAAGWYHPTLASTWELWTTSEQYEHALPLVAIVLFLCYRRWTESRHKRGFCASPAVSVPILAVSLIWSVGGLTYTEVLEQLSLIALLVLLVAAIFGREGARVFAVPLGLLLFTVPVWNALVPNLQHSYAALTSLLLSLTGIPALAEGTRISVPAGTFTVQAACSGLGQIIISASVGVLYSHLNRLRPMAFSLIVAGAVATAILANLFRIYSTVVVGQVRGMDHFFVTQHLGQGWMFFGAGMLGFFLVAGRVVRSERLSPPAVAAALSQEPMRVRGWSTRLATAALLSGLAMSVGPLLMAAAEPQRSEDGHLVFELPAQIGTWEQVSAGRRDFEPVFVGADMQEKQTYSNAYSRRVYVHVAQYLRQSKGKEAITHGGGIAAIEAWDAVGTRTRALDGGMKVQETRLRSIDGTQKLVWQWYYVHGMVASNVYSAKLLNAWGILNGDPGAAALIIATDVGSGVDMTKAEADLERFMTDSRVVIQKSLDGVLPRRPAN